MNEKHNIGLEVAGTRGLSKRERFVDEATHVLYESEEKDRPVEAERFVEFELGDGEAVRILFRGYRRLPVFAADYADIRCSVPNHLQRRLNDVGIRPRPGVLHHDLVEALMRYGVDRGLPMFGEVREGARHHDTLILARRVRIRHLNIA